MSCVKITPSTAKNSSYLHPLNMIGLFWNLILTLTKNQERVKKMTYFLSSLFYFFAIHFSGSCPAIVLLLALSRCV